MTQTLHFKQARSNPRSDALILHFKVQETQPIPPRQLDGVLRLSVPHLHGQATYDIQVVRGVNHTQDVGWQMPASALLTDTRHPSWGNALIQALPITQSLSTWQTAKVMIGEALSWFLTTLQHVHTQPSIRWQGSGASIGIGVVQTLNQRYLLARQLPSLSLIWEATRSRHSQTETLIHVQLRECQMVRQAIWQDTQTNARHWSVSVKRADPQQKSWHILWQIGRLPPWGRSPEPELPPLSPPGYVPTTRLQLRCPRVLSSADVRLVFGIHPCAYTKQTIPWLKVYMVEHHLSVVRLPNREPLAVKQLSLNTDSDMWCWQLRAELALLDLPLIEPTEAGPVHVLVTINDLSWVFVVEGYDMNRAFLQDNLVIQGRSQSAYLAEPYVAKQTLLPIQLTQPITARQLAEQVLTRADLITGFTLDWQLPDWLIPVGAWQSEALAPMGVIGRVVSTVGGMVSSHPRDLTVIAQARYPSLPWAWSNHPPDRVLPLSVIQQMSLKWQQKPVFNAVYVSGERTGVSARIWRSGTAADAIAPMVVDGLITHADAARARGQAILADVGQQALVSMTLPSLPEVGLLTPGLLVAVRESQASNSKSWRGLVRSTQLNATWQHSLSINQTIEVERHYL